MSHTKAWGGTSQTPGKGPGVCLGLTPLVDKALDAVVAAGEAVLRNQGPAARELPSTTPLENCIGSAAAVRRAVEVARRVPELFQLDSEKGLNGSNQAFPVEGIEGGNASGNLYGTTSSHCLIRLPEDDG